jgi:carboxylesterase type B
MQSDQMLICNTLDSLKLQAAGSPAFSYNFDIPAAVFLGACHGSEMPYVFGTGTQLTHGSKEAAASALMERYWTRFAAKGDPNAQGTTDPSDPMWPAFTTTSDPRMQFTLDGGSIVSGFHATECAYWIGRYEAAFTDPAFQPSL